MSHKVDYETKLVSMHVAFPVVSMRILDMTWLVCNKRFVAAFLRNKCHSGHITSSRVETAFNKWTSVSTGKVIVDIRRLW